MAEEDWLYLLDLVHWHRVSKVTMDAIISSKVNIPDYIYTSLQKLSKKSAMNNLAQISQLATIKKALEKEQVEFLFLKGVFLSMQLYKSPMERHSKDVDIWVQEGQVFRALNALKSIGFKLVKPHFNLKGTELKNYMLNQKDMVLVSTSGVIIEVELHWRLDKNRYCFPIDFEKAYSRHEQVAINNQDYPTMSLLDNYFYLSSHGTNALYGRLKWFLDWKNVCKTIEDQSSQANYNEVVQYANEMPTQSRQLSLSHYLLERIDPECTEKQKFEFLKYSFLVKIIAARIVNNWSYEGYMSFSKRWLFRLFLVRGNDYKFEQLRIALTLLSNKLFFRKGVYQ